MVYPALEPSKIRKRNMRCGNTNTAFLPYASLATMEPVLIGITPRLLSAA